MSDLLPAVPGLFLGSDEKPWDGSKLKFPTGNPDLDAWYLMLTGGVLTGDLRIDARLFFNASPTTTYRMLVQEAFESLLPNVPSYYFLGISPNASYIVRNMTTLAFLCSSGMVDMGEFNITNYQGLIFQPMVKANFGDRTITEANSIFVSGAFWAATGSLAITRRNLLKITASGNWIGTATVATQRGIWITALAATANALNIGIDIDNITSGLTRILLRAKGLSGDNVRVEAGDPADLASPTKAESQFLVSFNENGTVSVRRIKWKQQDQLVATDKVLIAE